MELTTFGLIMKFALESEYKLSSILETAKTNERFLPYADILNRLSAHNKNILKLLEQTRRENVNEIILQQISGLDEQNYLWGDKSPEQMTVLQLKAALEEIFQKMESFYQDSSAKVGEAANVFKRIAQQKQTLGKELKDSFGTII